MIACMKSRRIGCFLIAVALVVSIIFFSPIDANAITSDEVKSELDILRTQYPAGSDNPQKNCWYFVNMLSQSIFGHPIPTQSKDEVYKYYFTDSYKTNFVQIGKSLTIKDGTLTESSLKDLLSDAKPGDVIQMDYTTWEGADSLHVMMVYSASSTGAVFYHAGSTIYFGAGSGSDKLNLGTTGKELTWAQLKAYFYDYDDGISLYRSKKVNVCSHTYDGKGVCTECGYEFPYDNDRDTAYAGTYKVKEGATAYIREGPYQKCTEVTHVTTGTFTVKARVLNCKGNYWYELAYNGNTYYCVAGNLESVHTHVFEIGYETAHPHKQYKKCSCGYTEYTGATKLVDGCATCYPQATYGSTNPDDYVYPERSLVYTSPTMKGKDVAWVQAVLYQLGYSIDVDGSYGKNSVATVKQFQTDHGMEVDGHCGPATRAKLLELWNAKKHTHYYSSYGDATHPHNEYVACSCGDKQYTGSNYTSWEGEGYEVAHPHEGFRTCWCGYREYTGEYQTVGTCSECLLTGDFTGDREVNNEDVVYLLWHTLFPEDYSLSNYADFNNDGNVDNEDVVYLLWHTLFPGDYEF